MPSFIVSIPPFTFLKTGNGFIIKTVFDNLGRHADSDSVWWNISSNNCSSANDNAIANTDTIQNGNISTNEHIIANYSLLMLCNLIAAAQRYPVLLASGIKHWSCRDAISRMYS